MRPTRRFRSTLLAAFAAPLLLVAPATPLSAQAPESAGDGCTLSGDLLSMPVAAPSPSTDAAGRDTAARALSGVQPATASPAIILRAAASARSIRFGAQPQIRVRLCHGIDSVRVTERRNLPTPVVAGTTYEDVYISMELLAHVDGACLAERLLQRGQGGEAPARAAADSTRTADVLATARARCASLQLGTSRGSAGP